MRELEPYQEQRKKILNASKSEEINEKFKELYEIKVDIPIRTINRDIIDGLELSTKDYMSFEFMIEPESRSE